MSIPGRRRRLASDGRLVLSWTAHAGSLGHATLFHGRASAAVFCHGLEFFAGFDYLRIGAVELQGPLASVRWWF